MSAASDRLPRRAGGDSMTALSNLESRVAKKFAAKAAARAPAVPDLDLTDWFSGFTLPALPMPAMQQFPRERWITWPNRRLVTLMTIDRALDSDLNTEQWAQVTLLMHYGGRERVA